MRRAAYICFLLAGCGQEAGPVPNVQLGVVIDLTGSLAHPQWRAAAELAIDHANAGLALAGGHRDLRLGVEIADSLNLSKMAGRRAAELVAAGSKALVLDTSDNAVTVLRTMYDTDRSNDLAVPVICAACVSPDLGNPAAAVPNRADQDALRNTQGWGFRTSASSDAEAMLLLRLARTLGDRGDTSGDAINKLGLALVRDLEGNGFLESIERARPSVYPNVIVEVVRHDREIDVDANDWKEALVRLTDDRNEERLGAVDGPADSILEVTYPLYAAALTRAYVEAGVQRAPFLHHHNWRHDQTLIKLRTFDVDGQRGVSHAIADNCDSSGGTFWRTLEEATGRAPSLFDAQVYDAVMLLALGVVAAMNEHDVAPATVTPTHIRDALHTLSTIPAADPRHDPVVEAARVPVYAGAEAFAAAVEAIEADLPLDYVGASGPVDFDAYGNVRGNFVLYKVESGRFVDVEMYECLTDPALCPVGPPCNP